MRTADGQTFGGKFVFRAVEPPSRLVYDVCFTDPSGAPIPHPLAPDWPLWTRSEMHLEAADGGATRMIVRSVPFEASEVGRATYRAGHDSVRQGFAPILDQLSEHLSEWTRHDASYDPCTTYIQLAPDGTCEPIAVTPDFWPDLAAGRLTLPHRTVMGFRFDGDWSHWEMHPQADELVVCSEGSMDIVLERDGAEEVSHLTAGRAMVIPRGVWHTGRQAHACRAIFATQGHGTEHRPA